MHRSISKIWGWVIIVCLSIIFLFCIVWFFPISDRGYYKNYKKYESRIDVKLKNTIEEVEKYKKLYYSNKMSKEQMILHLEQGSEVLEDLYDSFKWKKGDKLTKELYVLKKQIIINYSQVYKNKAEALDEELYYSENEEMIYISTIVDRYNIKDKLEKEKFNIRF